MNLGERLIEIRGKETQKDFGERFGATANTLRRYENNINPPGSDFISSVCKHYNIEPNWLLFGEGEKYKTEIKQEHTHEDSHIETDFDLIPLVETELSAGGGAFVQSERIKGFYSFRKDWICRVATSAKDLVMMNVIGDSMSPTIQQRDTVMIDTSRKKIREGEIYAIRADHTVMIKRISFRPGGKLLIISDNKKEYEAYEADYKDVVILGQVVWFSRTLV